MSQATARWPDRARGGGIVAESTYTQRALEADDAGAACLSINPGNIARERVGEVIDAARANGCEIRIGSSRSLEQRQPEEYGEPAKRRGRKRSSTYRIIEDRLSRL